MEQSYDPCNEGFETAVKNERTNKRTAILRPDIVCYV